MKIENFTQLYSLIKGRKSIHSFESSVSDYNVACNCEPDKKEGLRKKAVANYIAAVNYLNSNKPLAFALINDKTIEFYNDGILIVCIKQ